MIGLCPSCLSSLHLSLGENPRYQCVNCGQRFMVRAINEENDAIAVTYPIGVVKRQGTIHDRRPDG